MVSPTKVFKSRSKPKTIHTKHKGDDKVEVELDWYVKPLSPRLMVKNYKHFSALEQMDKGKEPGEELSREEEIETLEKLAPLIDVVLPYCCVRPKIVEEGETNDTQVNIDDLDVETLMALFSEIFKASGISEEGDKERKNLGKPPSPKQLPHSA